MLARLAVAQSEIGGATLGGTILDPSGAGVPGAKVSVTNPATRFTRSTQTSGAGLYTFSGLPVGVYEVTVDANGFKSSKLTGVALEVGAVATLDVHLEIGATQETVSVTADVGVVEATRSQTSTVVNERAVADLPVNGRNFLDFTLLTPGVDRDLTRYGDISFGGQRGTSNSILVDGSDSNNLFYGQATGRTGTGRNPYSFSQDSVQEFQVSTNGYAAEVGRAGGGVINVITKSGTNSFHGSAFEFFRDKALNANTWLNNRSRRAKSPYHFNQFGGNVGGPIVKDKAFFFFDYDGQRNTTPNPVFLQVGPDPANPLSVQGYNQLQKYLTPYTNGLNNNVYLVKGDWNLSGSQRLSVRYNANRFSGVNFEFTGPNSALEHTGNSTVNTDNIAGNYTKTIGSRALFESRFIYTRDDEPGGANGSGPEGQIFERGTLVLYIGRNYFSPRYANIKTYQIVDSVSYQRGKHDYKMGLDISVQRIVNYFPGNFAGSFQFSSYADFAALKPSSFTQAFAGPGTDGPLTHPDVNEYAFYAQDSWRVSDRLTLNYGIRYDLFSYSGVTVKNPDPGLAALGLDTSRINPDHNNWAGRFGFAYKPSRDGKLVLRGGWGMYYARVPSILWGTQITQNGIAVKTYTISTGIPTYPNILSAPPSTGLGAIDILVTAPDYVSPLTHQWSFNAERQLGRDYALTLGYLGVRGEHLSRTRDINLFPAVATQGTYSNGTPVTFYRYPSSRPDPNFRRISLVDSGADSIYHGGFIQLTKRFSQSFQAQTSYTFSKVIDSDPDFTAVVVGGGDDAKVAQDTLNPNLERGLGNSDIRHRFVLSGIWDINYAKSLQNRFARAALSGYQLSPIVTLQSGRFYSATVGGNGDPNNDGNRRSDRPPYVGRNTIETPGYATVDLRFSRDIPLYKERASLRLIFEAFNLTNRANFGNLNPGTNSFGMTQYNFNSATRVFTPEPTFRTPLNTFDPRILQLAAKITF
jgi:hypothetical protein